MIVEFNEFLRSVYAQQNEFYEASKYIYDEAQKQAISRDLLKLYEIESKRLLLIEEIKSARMEYENARLKNALVPRRWRRLFRRKENAAAKNLESTVDDKVEAFFGKRLTLNEVLETSDDSGECTPEKTPGNAAGLRPDPE